MYKLRVLLFLLAAVAAGCNNDTLLLKKTELPEHYEIDTLEQYPKQGIQIINLVNVGAMGHFSVHLAVVKNLVGSSKIIYELEEGRDEWGRLSKDYIAFVKPSTNHGWFLIENGIIKNQLPGMGKIVDTLKGHLSKDETIRESDGYIFVYENGKIISELNYGNLLNDKLRKINFDSLNYGLYKFNGDSLVTISTETNDIKLQTNGLFYVPTPGFDVIRKYRKKDVLKLVDSAAELSPIPYEISVKPN
jgi:hypothetical protein